MLLSLFHFPFTQIQSGFENSISLKALFSGWLLVLYCVLFCIREPRLLSYVFVANTLVYHFTRLSARPLITFSVVLVKNNSVSIFPVVRY